MFACAPNRWAGTLALQPEKTIPATSSAGTTAPMSCSANPELPLKHKDPSQHFIHSHVLGKVHTLGQILTWCKPAKLQ